MSGRMGILRQFGAFLDGHSACSEFRTSDVDHNVVGCKRTRIRAPAPMYKSLIPTSMTISFGGDYPGQGEKACGPDPSPSTRRHAGRSYTKTLLEAEAKLITSCNT